MFKVEEYDAGSRNMLAVVYEGDRVLVIGEGYVTVWRELADFEKRLDGEDIEPLDTYDYTGV